MIDMHSHILPNIDDGSKSVEETFNLIKEASSVGFTAIVSTSHYIEGYYESEVAERQVWVTALSENLKKLNIKMDLYLGNEAYFSENIVDLLNDMKITTINNSNYLLFELPMNAEPLNLYDVIFKMQQNHLIPILAHPERYGFVQKNPDVIYDLVEKGVLIQSNYGSIIGQYGKKAEKTFKKLLKDDLIHVLGSDVHREDTIYPRIPEVLDELEKIVGEEKVYELTTKNPMLIISNKTLDIE